MGYDKIVAAIKANNNIVLDDHFDGRRGNLRTLTMVGAYVKGGVIRCVPLLEDTVFCINPIYIDEEDGLPHLSSWSCGGSVYGEKEPMEIRVTEYLRDSQGTIHDIVRL